MTYKVIGVLGDSITNGYWDEDGLGWFGRLSQKIAVNFKFQYGFNNMSNSGDRVCDCYHRLACESLTRRIDILLISVGVNDITRTPEENSPNDISIALRSKYWKMILDLSKKSGAKVIVLDILPICEQRYPLFMEDGTAFYRKNDDVEEYNLMLEKLCKEYHVKFIKRYDKWKSRDLISLYRDTAHPLGVAHQMIADEVYEELLALKIIV